jgi:hypothetical protein
MYLVRGQGVERQERPRSLRSHLVMIPTIILFAGLVATVGTILLDAQARIAAEVRSAMELGRDFITTSLHNVADANSPVLAFEQLAEELPRVRHVQFELGPPTGRYSSAATCGVGRTYRALDPGSRAFWLQLPESRCFLSP